MTVYIRFCFFLFLLPPTSLLWAQEASYVPRHENPQGDELVVVYISASNCESCLRDDFKTALETMKRLLAEQASNAGLGFVAQGVALDWDVDAGYQFLKAFGAFDEIVVGRNWFNIAANEYIWESGDTIPLIPQVLVFLRETSLAPERVSFGPRRIIGRYLGDTTIVAWVQRGAPVDLATR
ncbi:MAG: hypothetical protein D6800_12840 [Candidatus Zixiibacteriota bacterium]|nr:MAG: hypothetical protein D6800_12840 [candidate division Zixibacteria bacterium]